MPHRTGRAASVVMVSDANGHGSGVYIGNGLVLTAAHVVGDSKTVTLHSDRDLPGEVLWSNKKYDLALVRFSVTVPDMPAARLDLPCAGAWRGP